MKSKNIFHHDVYYFYDLQVKGLADITGAGGGAGATAAAVTGNNKDEHGEFMGGETGGEVCTTASIFLCTNVMA